MTRTMIREKQMTVKTTITMERDQGGGPVTAGDTVHLKVEVQVLAPDQHHDTRAPRPQPSDSLVYATWGAKQTCFMKRM